MPAKISNRKKIWCGILTAELLLMLLYGLKFVGGGQTGGINLTQDELFYDTDESGFYLDTSFENKYIKTPDFTLSKGWYRLEAEMECAGGNVLEICYQDKANWHNMSGDIFIADSKVVSYDFEVKYGDWPLQVRGKLSDSALDGDYILIRNLKIAPAPFAVRYYLFRLLLILAVADFLFLFYMLRDKFRISRETGDHLKILVLLIIVSSVPLMVNYVFSQDLLFCLTRIEAIKQGLQNGKFPVKIQPYWLNGHGYAVSVFCGDLFLYVPAVLRLLGMSLQVSYQIYVLFVNIATVFVSYFCFSKMSSGWIGVFCTIVYSLNRYRLARIYTIGVVDEYTAMIFLPLVLYGMWRIYMLPEDEEAHGKSWLTLAIGCTGVFMCHIISAGITVLFLIIAALVLWKKTFRKKTFRALLKAAAATGLLSLWFLVPFLDYMCTGSYLMNSSELYQSCRMLIVLILVYLLCIFFQQEWIAKRARLLLAAVVVCLSFWQGVTYMSECLNDYEPSRVFQAENLTTFDVENGEYLPINERKEFQYETWMADYPNNLTYDESVVSVKEWHRSKDGVEVRLSNHTEDTTVVEVPLLLYKGYHAVTENGEELVLTPGRGHRIGVSVPGEYSGNIRVFFGELWYWRVCELLSAITAVGVILLVVKKYRFHVEEK